MSATSFLSDARRHSSDPNSRLYYSLANQIRNLDTRTETINALHLTGQARSTYSRLKLLHKSYIKQFNIQDLSSQYFAAFEPDLDKLTYWVRGNRTGHQLNDLSKMDNEIKTAFNQEPICITDIDFDVGYYSQNGKYPAIWMNGSTDDPLDVTDSTNTQLKDVSTGMTWCMWLYPLSIDQHRGRNRTLFAKKDDDDNGYRIVLTSTGKVDVTIKDAGTTYTAESDASTISINNLYLVTVTYNASTNAILIYINTTSYNTASTAFDLPANDTNLHVFHSGLDEPEDELGEGYFAGYCPDHRIYREKILSSSEITNLHTNKVTISNLALGKSAFCGYSYAESTASITSFTSTSFTSDSFKV